MRELIRRCLVGDEAACAEFQDAYGQLIYDYPVRRYRLAADAAGDFYLFAFEVGRIYRRLRTFEGRTTLRAYLLGSVLDHLLLDWRRTQREPETVCIDALDGVPDPEGEPGESVAAADPLAGVAVARAIVMKLLYIQDFDLTAADLQYLVEQTNRPPREVLAAVRALRRSVGAREAEQRRVADALDSAHAWASLYERRLYEIDEELGRLPASAPATTALQAQRSVIEGKVHRRRSQRASLLRRLQGRRVHAPYREVAALLNTSAANVATQIRRLRRELAAALGIRRVGPAAGRPR